jgi:hypothetical protein
MYTVHYLYHLDCCLSSLRTYCFWMCSWTTRVAKHEKKQVLVVVCFYCPYGSGCACQLGVPLRYARTIERIIETHYLCLHGEPFHSESKECYMRYTRQLNALTPEKVITWLVFISICFPPLGSTNLSLVLRISDMGYLWSAREYWSTYIVYTEPKVSRRSTSLADEFSHWYVFM